MWESIVLSSLKRKERPDRFGTVFYTKTIPAVIAIKNDVIDDILDGLRKLSLLDDEMGIRLCLDEAICNSIQHGCDEDPNKKVTVECYSEGIRWGVVFTDEGEGFPPRDLPDFSNPENLFAEGGRGLFLMNYYMDSMEYCGKGNILELTKTYKLKVNDE